MKINYRLFAAAASICLLAACDKNGQAEEKEQGTPCFVYAKDMTPVGDEVICGREFLHDCDWEPSIVAAVGDRLLPIEPQKNPINLEYLDGAGEFFKNSSYEAGKVEGLCYIFCAREGTVPGRSGKVIITYDDGNVKFDKTLTLIADVKLEEVDMGLKVKWASFNIGAGKPEEYGLYYQWGDTQGYTSDPSDGKLFQYRVNETSHYKWSHLYNSELTKYVPSDKPDFGYNGFTDGKTVLDKEDDAAAAALGGKWRMPTEEEIEELLYGTRCSREWVTVNNVYGTKVTSLVPGYTDKWIFLPAAGARSNNTYEHNGIYGFYWTSSVYLEEPDNAVRLYTAKTLFEKSRASRAYGFSIRAVTD